MPVDEDLLTITDANRLVHEAIVAIEVALERNPTAEETAALREQLVDLQRTGHALAQVHSNVVSGEVRIAPRGAGLVPAVRHAITAVQTARTSGAAMENLIAAVTQALTAATSVMTLAGPHRPVEPPDGDDDP